MQVITRRGTVLGGVEAYAYIWRHIWWTLPLALLCHLPLTREILKWLYRRLATNRHRIAGTCKLQPPPEENPYAIDL
jgi:hypothetical protein